MTPAVTAIALIRFARVDRSTSTGIGYASEKKTNTARHVLNGINEWAIDFHFNRRRFWATHCRRSHHHYCSCRSRLRPFFVHGDEGLVKDVGDVEVIIRLARRHLIKIRAALRDIECAFHSQRLKVLRERNRRWFELELWQMQIDILCFELVHFAKTSAVRCNSSARRPFTSSGTRTRN